MFLTRDSAFSKLVFMQQQQLRHDSASSCLSDAAVLVGIQKKWANQGTNMEIWVENFCNGNWREQTSRSVLPCDLCGTGVNAGVAASAGERAGIHVHVPGSDPLLQTAGLRPPESSLRSHHPVGLCDRGTTHTHTQVSSPVTLGSRTLSGERHRDRVCKESSVQPPPGDDGLAI